MPGDASDGSFALIEFLFPRVASPPLHEHPQDESYVGLDGKLSIVADGRRFELDAEGAAVPMGVPHTFRVDSETARVLLLGTPAGSSGSCATAPSARRLRRFRRATRSARRASASRRSSACTVR